MVSAGQKQRDGDSQSAPMLRWMLENFGQSFLVFCRLWRDPGRPRLAIVTGWCEAPGRVHLTAFMDPHLDVHEYGDQPIEPISHVLILEPGQSPPTIEAAWAIPMTRTAATVTAPEKKPQAKSAG